MAACVTVHGSLLVPTGSHSPPIRTIRLMQDARVVYWIEGGDRVRNERPFTLISLDPQTGQAVGGTQVFVPDFDIFWFDVNGNSLKPQIHADPGDESGDVPKDADHGIVFMSHGPGTQPPSDFEYQVC
ncbi:MAG: hypothetical protein KY455_11845 [Euryarchaeota archaeon]|nr:hypothetical protein [Euryarchaeota archaeon]